MCDIISTETTLGSGGFFKGFDLSSAEGWYYIERLFRLKSVSERKTIGLLAFL
ncbi:MAG: hypothetical protein HY354_04070 [Planctomycetes bacterium]|nr:hypothetical protein [Planctomycetota bacterium]